MSNVKHYPLHPNATHPPVMTCEIPLEEYESLKRENAELNKGAKNLILDNYIQDKETRHQKYKRCLAMAKWCADVRELMHKLPVTDVDADRRRMKKCKWCRKWRNRWLSIAEKFKEAK